MVSRACGRRGCLEQYSADGVEIKCASLGRKEAGVTVEAARKAMSDEDPCSQFFVKRERHGAFRRSLLPMLS